MYCGFIFLYLLKHRQTESGFACVNHLDWGLNVATEIIVNIFFNNKQTLKEYCPKESANGFKKRQKMNYTMFKFLFFAEGANVNYYDRMVFIKFRQNLWKNL